MSACSEGGKHLLRFSFNLTLLPHFTSDTSGHFWDLWVLNTSRNSLQHQLGALYSTLMLSSWSELQISQVKYLVLWGCPHCRHWKLFLGSAKEEMPISHKIRQYRPLLGFAHLGEILCSAERGWGSHTEAGNMAGFYAPNSGWLPLGARNWSPGTKRQSIIGGSPWAQAARRISPPILTDTNHKFQVVTCTFNCQWIRALWVLFLGSVTW